MVESAAQPKRRSFFDELARWGELAHVVRWVAPGGKAGDAEQAARLLDESLFQARAGGVLATVRMAAIFVSYFRGRDCAAPREVGG